jgi:hypothetical protein
MPRPQRKRLDFLRLKKGEEVTGQVKRMPNLEDEPLHWANGDVYCLDIQIDGGETLTWVINDGPEAEALAEVGAQTGDHLRLWRDSLDPPEFEDGREVTMIFAEPADPPQRKIAPAGRQRRSAAPRAKARPSTSRPETEPSEGLSAAERSAAALEQIAVYLGALTVKSPPPLPGEPDSEPPDREDDIPF